MKFVVGANEGDQAKTPTELRPTRVLHRNTETRISGQLERGSSHLPSKPLQSDIVTSNIGQILDWRNYHMRSLNDYVKESYVSPYIYLGWGLSHGNYFYIIKMFYTIYFKHIFILFIHPRAPNTIHFQWFTSMYLHDLLIKVPTFCFANNFLVWMTRACIRRPWTFIQLRAFFFPTVNSVSWWQAAFKWNSV